MYKLIGENNKVNYGSIDEVIDFNYKDFKLLNFFGKELKGFVKNNAFHKFNYIGIITDNFLIGIAAVDLNYMHNVFAYLFDYKTGVQYEYSILGIGNKKLGFSTQPDEYVIDFKKGKSLLKVTKSHKNKALTLDASFNNKLNISLKAQYSLETHQPLRVLNPSEPTRWTFTEKCSPIIPTDIKIEYNGNNLTFDKSKTSLLYDWTGGYLRRQTNWFWAAFSGFTQENTIGANLASLVNESYFNENAFWIDGKRTRSYQCIFDFDLSDPYKPWHVWNEAKTIDIWFQPEGERKENINALFIKTAFTQFVGKFSGTFIANNQVLKFENIYGFTEYHRAIW